MSKNIYLALCENSVVDQSSRTMSLIKIIERLKIDPSELEERLTNTELPEDEPIGLARPMQVVGWWVRSDHEQPEDLEARFGFRSPGGSFAEVGTTSFDLTQHTGVRINTQIQGIPWGGLGLYWFVVEERPAGSDDQWRTTAEFPLELAAREPTRT